MIETWLKSAKKYFPRPASRAFWSFIPPVRWLMVIFVVAVIGGRLIWIQGQRPAHLREIADAFDSVGIISGAPQVNGAGDKFTFIRSTTNGAGIFLYDLTKGQKQLLVEKQGSESDDHPDLNVCPWSPDDKLFIYTRRGGGVFICDGETGKNVASLSAGDEGVNGLTWLAPDRFAYVGQSQLLYLVGRQSDGAWQQTPTGIKAGTFGLTALSANMLAWSWDGGGSIWVTDLAAGTNRLFYQPPKGMALETFSCAQASGQFLLKLRSGDEHSLWWLNASNEVGKICDCPADASEITLVKGTDRGCAYAVHRTPVVPDHNLILVTDPHAKPMTLFSDGNANQIRSDRDGTRLIIVGTASNGINDGMWEYEVAGQVFRGLVPCSDSPSVYAKHILPSHEVFRSAGTMLSYSIFAPRDFDRRQSRKYPLVIGDTPTFCYWQFWGQTPANCDAFVVIINRPGWGGEGLDKWNKNVFDLYRRLARDPAIDTSRVFLFGTSAETSPLSKLVEKYPQFWKGIMLFNPSVLPKLETVPASKILISTAVSDEGRAKQYQQEALKYGVAVDVVIHTNCTHYPLSMATFRERGQAAMDFIFDN
jgi:hypothetical protein